MSTKQDPIFAAYAKTAPLLDLRAYLGYATRKVAEYELSDRTLNTVAEMVALERELAGVDGTPAHGKRVWATITRFKESIPNWAGLCGAKGSWAPIDEREAWPTWKFLQCQAAGDRDHMSLFQLLDRYAVKHASECDRAEAMHRFGVPLRATPLTIDEATALIPTVEAATVPAPAKRAVRKQASLEGLPCPKFACTKGRLAYHAADRLTCSVCKSSWTMTPFSATQKAAAAKRVAKVMASTEKPRRYWLVRARTADGQDRYAVETEKRAAEAARVRFTDEGLEVVEFKARFDFTLREMGLLEAA